MAPAQATPVATPVSPLAAALSAAVGIATDNAVLLTIWGSFVLIDFVSAWIRVFVSDSERWAGVEALRGLAKKFAYFMFVLAAALLDIASGELVATSVGELGLLTKGTLAILVGIEAGSALRNLRDATGEWRIFRMLTVAIDRLRNPDEAEKERRWYDPDEEEAR